MRFFHFFPHQLLLFSVFRLTIPKNALNYTINTRIIDLDPLIEDASPNAQNERTYPKG